MLFGKVGAGKGGGGRTIGQQGSGSAGGGPEVPGPSGVAGAELGPGGGRMVSSLCQKISNVKKLKKANGEDNRLVLLNRD